MMKITENFLLFIFLVLFSQTCYCLNPPHTCSPSSCGNIRNIRLPFRLKNDPKECGDPRYELECENNVTTILSLNSQKYKVKAIHYVNSSILLSDVSVENNNTCSFPNVSLNNYLLRDSPYLVNNSMPISFMSCPYALKNSSSSVFFTELPSHCNNNTPTLHTYIMVGYFKASDVRVNCSVELKGQTSWDLLKNASDSTWWGFRELKNVSFSEIHDSLLYGFQLSFYWYFNSTESCTWCNGRWECALNIGERVRCRHSLGAMLEALWAHIKFLDYPYEKNDYTFYPNDRAIYPNDRTGPNVALVLIVLLILVVVFAGVTLPAKIIFGFISASAFIFVEFNQERLQINIYWPLEHRHFVIELFFSVRFIIVFPCIIWFLIYKFRRRHLSRYAIIEDFLQSENNLMPIRYSYSDIKKMTRGFRQKLGQGGYGTVYKGKLQSGYDVAVKLLGKPGGNGQDFMNEIATIGRIHHVNIVKLVGYCAEGSKRALLFDYMPNGSLDKYLNIREETNCLSWGRKYEIAIGVARGIEYLHRGCDIQILHFDIKPHNILLDDNFTPKITDFGLAKFFSRDKKVVTMTAVRGTIGYVAPELINRGFGGVSYKADVYSFGMLLIEMVGLNKDSRRNNQASSQYFPDWIYDYFEQGHDIEIGTIDENDDDGNINDSEREIVKKMTIVALWCIQMSPNDRPSMNKVLEMLEAQVERLRVPNRPAEVARVTVIDEDESWSTYPTDSIPLLPRDAAFNVEMVV